MENAVDALKIAFGFLVFVMAITVAFMLFSQAKSTSDAVMFSSDNTNFYTYESNNTKSIVGVDTVIAMLYRYYTESLKIDVGLNADSVKSFDISNPIPGGISPKQYADNFVKDKLLNLDRNVKFEETFSEEDGVTKIKYMEITS